MITSNRHIALIPQIESVKGMDNLEEIAAIPQVSALMFGPTDYSSDAGLPGPTTGLPNPGLIEAMSRFSSLGRKYDKSLLGWGPDRMQPGPIANALGIKWSFECGNGSKDDQSRISCNLCPLWQLGYCSPSAQHNQFSQKISWECSQRHRIVILRP